MDILQLSPHKQRLLGELIGLARATEGNDHLLQSETCRRKALARYLPSGGGAHRHFAVGMRRV